MPKASEEISKYNANSGGKTDSNLSNDSLHLGGIPAEQYATKKYVQDYHGTKEAIQKEYIDEQNKSKLDEAKAYTDQVVSGQDFSNFAKVTDVQAVDTKLTNKINEDIANQKAYTDTKTQAIVNDVNNNFNNVNNAISVLNDTQNELFQSVSSGKSKVAGAITDKGVSTSANDTFDTMASNIRSISSGGGSTDPNYVNTSDATATASDILNGKTAYVQGQKVYGNFVYTGSNTGEYNPDNPYPTKAEVELVYGEKENDIEVNNIGTISSTIYDISADKRLLVAYDSTDNKIKTFLRQGDNSYKQEINQNGEYITPIYSLSDLGITENSNYTLKKIKMSIMNTDENISGYECKIALLFIRTVETESSTSNALTYVFRISTFNGEIKTENENILAGTEGNENSYIYYNRWEISSSYKSTTKPSAYTLDLIWSPDFHTLAVVHNLDSNNIELYQFANTTMGENVDYANAIKQLYKTTIGGSFWSDTYKDLKFVNMDRILFINWTTSNGGSGTRRKTILIFDENFNLIKRYSDSSSSSADTASAISNAKIISNDGLYATGDGKLYSVTTNYVTGEMGVTELGTGITCDAEKSMFTKDNKYLITMGTASTTIYVYAVDFINGTFKLIYSGSYTAITLLSGLRSAIGKNNTMALIETIVDGQNLIGIKYNGEIFYKNIYNPGRFTAGQPDVRAGKTFIGYMGIPEIGTMEVSE